MKSIYHKGPVFSPALSVTLILANTISAQSQDSTAADRENQLKAAFLYKFLFYVTWPEEKEPHGSEPFVIGIVGESPIDNILREATRDLLVRNHSIEVKLFADGKAQEEMKKTHLLFVSRKAASAREEVLKSIEGSSVLSVSDTDEFAKRGGMIELATRDEKIVFLLNVKAANAEKVNISSKLIKLGKVVDTEPGEEKESK